MKRAIGWLLCWVLAAGSLPAQEVVVGRRRASGGSGVNWTLVQATPSSAEATCGSAGVPCTLSVTSTGSGNLGVLFVKNTDGTVTLGSVSNGGTWVLPSQAGGTNTGCAPTLGVLDCAYVLSTSSGTTSISWQWNDGAVHGHVVGIFYEFSRGTGTATLDTICQAQQESAATSHTGCAFTLSGTKDVLLQGMVTRNSTLDSINNSYVILTTCSTTTCPNPSNIGFGGAYKLNSTDATAPTWSGGNNFWYWNGLAFK